MQNRKVFLVVILLLSGCKDTVIVNAEGTTITIGECLPPIIYPPGYLPERTHSLNLIET